MSVAVLRPDSTTANTGTVTGASAHAALSDDTNTTYVACDAGEFVTVTMGDLTLPAGAVVKHLRVRARAQALFASGGLRARLVIPGQPFHEPLLTIPASSVVTYSYALSPPYSDAQVDAASVTMISLDTTVRVYEVYLDATYVAQPVCAVSAPGGTLTDTNRPTVEWTPTLDSDGGVQAQFEVKIFSSAQYGAGGFDPDTSQVTDYGLVASAATAWQGAATLPDDDYRAYVRVAQTVNGTAHWSDWDYEAFTIDVIVPDVPTLTLTAESSRGRMRVEVAQGGGIPSTDLFEIQRTSRDFAQNIVPNPRPAYDATGWGAYQDGGTGTVEHHPTFEGPDSRRGVLWLKATSAISSLGAVLPLDYAHPVAPDETYTVTGHSRAVTTPRAFQMIVAFYEADGTFISSTSGSTKVNSAVAWTRATDLTVTAPALAALMTIYVSHNALANGEQHLVGQVMGALGDSLGEYADGDTPGFEWQGQPHASISQRGSWLPVRADYDPVGFVAPVDGGAVVRDYEAPNGVTVYWRARALHDYSGAYAGSAWRTEAGEWSSTQWWLKHPNLPAFNLPVTLVSYPDASRTSRQGVLQPVAAELPVVVSDTRGGATGTVVLYAFNLAEQDKLAALLDTTATLLLQGPAGDDKADRYIRVGDHQSVRVVDKSFAPITAETLQWILVAVPSGAQDGGQYSGLIAA